MKFHFFHFLFCTFSHDSLALTKISLYFIHFFVLPSLLGGHPNPIVIPCLIQSLQLLLGLGVENIYQKLRKLVIMINKGVEEKGRGYLRVRGEEGEEGGHYTGIGFTGREEDKHTFNLKVREKLREKKIFISVRCGWLRVSPYAVVTEEEIERFLGALGEVVGEVVSEMGLEK